MKRLVLVFSLLVSISIVLSAQVDLTYIGGTSAGSVVSGSMLTWTITVPVGAMVNNELWLDVNTNGVVDQGTDKLVFQFSQIDGGGTNDGPGDNDGSTNGVITTSFAAGLAPAQWIFVVKHASGDDFGVLLVQPLSSPAATITGTVTVPDGYSKSNLLIEASPQSSSDDHFWHGLTDASGNYTIAIGGSPFSMNPWRVRLGEGTAGYGLLVTLRRDTTVTLSGTPAVVNFSFIVGTVLTGQVVDQFEQPIMGAYPHTHDASDIGYDVMNIGGRTDENGYFSIVVAPGNYKLHYTARGYFDAWWGGSGFDNATVISVVAQDSIKGLDAMLNKGALVEGQIRNYGMPVQGGVTIYANGEMQVWSGSTGSDGRWDATLSPGTYVIEFSYQSQTQYYDHSNNWPGNSVTISGTETHSNIDADFSVGIPPNLPTPEIVNIWDVPNDNGRQVYIQWTGVEGMLDAGDGDGMPFEFQTYSIERREGGNWVYMKSVEASGEEVYTTIVPTLRDSTKTEGMYWSRYRVKAHFIFNLVVVRSEPDSGYSLDNLAPGVPAGFSSSVSGSDVVLRWAPNEEEDFKYYTVYRSTNPLFSVGSVTSFGYTASTEFVDLGAATSTLFYYRITSTDHAGNESAPSILVNSAGTTLAEEPGQLPATFTLHRNYPNPFNPTTLISYDLPTQSHVTLSVYNALGEEVARLVDGAKPAGTFSVSFDASGLPSGLYFCRLQAEHFTATQKMSLIK